MPTIVTGYLILNKDELWVRLCREVAALAGGRLPEVRGSRYYELRRYFICYIGQVKLLASPCISESNEPGVLFSLHRPERKAVLDMQQRENILERVASQFFEALKKRYGDRLHFDATPFGHPNFKRLFAPHECEGDEVAVVHLRRPGRNPSSATKPS